MRSRITLLSQSFPPETHAGANRIGSMARVLAEKFEVTVVTVQPSYPSPGHYRVYAEPGAGPERVNVVRISAFHPYRGPTFVRGVREVLMARRLARRAVELSAETVIATSPSLFTGVAGWKVARRLGSRFVWDLRDLTWSYIGDDGRRAVWAKPASFALRKLASWLASRAAIVSVSNEGIAEEVVRLGVDPDRVVVVANGVSADLMEQARRLPPLQVEGPPTVTYAGAIGYYQGLETLLDVAEILPAVTFNVIGMGSERNRLLRDVGERALENVNLPGYMNREQLFDVYSSTHIFFAQLRDLPSLSRATVPTKPFEYMATGRPIVYGGSGITAELLNSIGCALVVASGDPLAVAHAIERLFNDVALMMQLGSAGKSAAPRFQREALLEPLVRRLDTGRTD